jgi:hypothetical protein
MKQSLHNVIGSTYSSSSLDSETMKKVIVLIPTKYMDISADAIFYCAANRNHCTDFVTVKFS